MSAATQVAKGPDPTRAEELAQNGAWLAVAAGTLGAFVAALDISIVNASLPVIQGDIGASAPEATWIGTAYLVAEIVAITLSGWLERILGLRRLLLWSVATFATASLLCGLSTSLGMMIVGRALQGFSGGILIPMAMLIIATRLPPSKQPAGNAFFVFAAIIGPIAGPILGGWLTENMSWHLAFFINIPLAAVLAALILTAIPASPVVANALDEADWLGIVGLVLGLGSLTFVLEQGQREGWFASSLVSWLAAAVLAGFAMLLAGQKYARKPVIRLKLLTDRQFASVMVLTLLVGMVMYGPTYVIPQFLITVAGYSPVQAGKIVLLAGLAWLFVVPLAPLLLARLDMRIGLTVALAILAYSSLLGTTLTSQSGGEAFVVQQLLRGIGTILAFVYLNQAAISAVPKELAGDSAGLYNAARNLGGTLALAGFATAYDQRLWFHSRRLEEAASQAPVELDVLLDVIEMQALVMTYNDLYVLLLVTVCCTAPLIFLLRRLPNEVVASS